MDEEIYDPVRQEFMDIFGAYRAGALHPASSETFACHETSVGNGDVLVYFGSS